MKTGKLNWVLAVAGLLLLGLGLFWVKTLADPAGVMRALPYVCVGLGCGVFGQGAGALIAARAAQRDPAAAKQLAAEQKDERNITIANRAKGRAYDVMLPVYGALMVAFALMGAELYMVLLLVAAYLFVCGVNVYYRAKYDKEM